MIFSNENVYVYIDDYFQMNVYVYIDDIFK